jgi:hypothetical protein
MTKAEIKWSQSVHAKRLDNLRYEAITLRAGDVRYTPDFSGTDLDGQVHFYEIKASGHRAAFTESARLKLSVMASSFPEYEFWVTWPDKSEADGWHVEEVWRHPIVDRIEADLPGQMKFI